MRKTHHRVRVLSALAFAAAAFGMLPGAASAQSTLRVRDFMLVGDGCPAMESAVVTLTPQQATAPGQIRIAFPDDVNAFVVTGSDAQRSCMVSVALTRSGARAELNFARGQVSSAFSGGEQGRLSVTSRVMVGRSRSAPITVQLNAGGVTSSDDQPDGISTQSVDRINARADIGASARVTVEISAETAGASPDAMIRINDIILLFSETLDASG